eukprot:834346-Rhodomonas_salina.1
MQVSIALRTTRSETGTLAARMLSSASDRILSNGDSRPLLSFGSAVTPILSQSCSSPFPEFSKPACSRNELIDPRMLSASAETILFFCGIFPMPPQQQQISVLATEDDPRSWKPGRPVKRINQPTGTRGARRSGGAWKKQNKLLKEGAEGPLDALRERRFCCYS